jgi:hypothetical protein
LRNTNEFEVTLHPGQAAIYNSPARFKVCAAGRRFGKSHFAAITLAEAAMTSVNRFGYNLTIEHGVYYVAPTFDQAKRVMWPKLKQILGYEKVGGLIRRENVNDGWIELVSGRRIYIKGADNPDSLRGIGLSYVVLDEYADMKSFVWDEILRPALMDVKGGALFIGTPKGKNHFYQLFMSSVGWPGGSNPSTYRSEDWEDWEGFHFKSMDNPFLDPEEVEREMRGSNKPIEVVRQEYEASFVSGGGKVLKPEWFDIVDRVPAGDYRDLDRFGNTVVSSYNDGSFYVTVDLAGFIKADRKIAKFDDTVIAVTYVTPESWYVIDVQHGQWDSREVALRIMRTCSRYHGCRLGIEKGALMNAIGPYLEDYMRDMNRYITPEPLSHGGTKKIDRISHALQGRAQRGRIRLLDDKCAMSKSRQQWVQRFLDQAADFPDPLAHDDLLDAVAYVDQMASVSYVTTDDIEEWQPLDLDSGY